MSDERKNKDQLIGELRELRKGAAESLAAEASLREKELELSDFIEKAALGLRRVGPDGTILWANKAEMDMLGYTPEEYIGHPFAEFGADQEVINDMFARLGRDEGLCDFEARMLHKDGSIRDVLISSNVLWKDGEFIHTRCCTRDVTERRVVEEELSKRNRDLEILNAITQAVHRSIDLEEVYKIALEMTTDLEEVDIAMIYLVDKDRKEAVLQAHKNLLEDYIRRAGKITYPIGFTWEVINTGKITNVEDSQKNPNVGPAGRALGHHGALGIPIVLEDKVIGVIWFLSYKERKYDEREVELLSTIGSQIALAIAKAKLYAELAKKNRYENIISAVTRSVHSSLDLQEVLENAVEAMSQNIDKAEHVAIFLVEGNEAVMKSHRGHPDWFVSRVERIPYPKGFTWKTIIEGKPRYVPDVDEDTAIGPAGREVGTQSYVSMPIKHGERSIGSINIYWLEKNAFDEEGLDLLEIVANQIEIAVNNARQADELQGSQARLSGILDNADEAIISTNEAQEIILFNRGAEKIFGYSSEEVLGKNLGDLMPERFRKAHTGQIQRFDPYAERSNMINKRSNICGLRKDGTEFPAEATISKLDTKDGVIYTAILRDITERRRLQEEIQKAQKLESIGVLAGGIAHDFNNLLAAILGGVSLAKLGLEQGDKKLAILEQTELACDRAANLTNQLLTFSMGGGPVKELASIAEIIKTSAGFVLRGSNVGYEVSIPEDISTVKVDPGQISQVIQNIVINAKQAIPNYGMIKLRAEDTVISPDQGFPLEEGEYVKISIEDEGEGIPAENIKKIFDPYFTTKQEGSGLGLATTYSIIKNHGGHITVESEMGVGTRFDIYIPASEGKPTAKAAEKELRDGRAKILVMDDDKTIRGIVTTILAELGYEVDSAGDGAEAIELYKKGRETGHPYDVVILDLTVQGGMGGKEAMEKLLEFDPQAAAIVSSGYSNDPVMADYGEYGFKGSISKPFKVEKLSEILHGVITEDEELKTPEAPLS